jgi:hypothetical protein
MKALDLIGQKFSRLTVIERSEFKGKRIAWRCSCECGNFSYVTTDALRSGKTGSCGCRKKETGKENCLAHGIKPRHGMTGTGAHNSWTSMIERCRGQGSGGRYKRIGVEVCKRWEIFENFYEDMRDRPIGMTIDRINNSEGYSKDNCRWATNSQQQRNKSNAKRLLVNGKIVALMDFADEHGIKKTDMYYFVSVTKKLAKLNISVEVI